MDSTNKSEIPEEKTARKDSLSTAPLKGFRDFYPEQQRLQSWIFNTLGNVAETFGFQPYNGPILEAAELYIAKSGDELGGEQLYHFTDKGERQVAIRPEMTPSLARMVANKANELVMPLRWYSTPNLLRYERPQRGRLREHWQLNVDIIGSKSLYAEAEILELGISIMRALGAPESAYSVHINNRRFLNDILAVELKLPPEKVALAMKLIDRKAKIPPETFDQGLSELGLEAKGIQTLKDLFGLSLDEIRHRYGETLPGAKELVQLFEILDRQGLSKHCQYDFGIVRGIAYYTGTVFELFDNHPDNRRSLFGGGRYDNLMGLFERPEISAVGFGLGDVTIANFLETHGLTPALGPAARVMVLFPDAAEAAVTAGLKIAQDLRRAGIPVESCFPGDMKFDKQMKLANRRGIDVVVFAGSNELQANSGAVKDLRVGEQWTVPLGEINAKITSLREKK